MLRIFTAPCGRALTAVIGDEYMNSSSLKRPTTAAFVVMVALALAGCGGLKPNTPYYAKGMSAADVPAQTTVIALEKFEPIDNIYEDDEKHDIESHVDAKASSNDKEVLDLARKAMIAKFQENGITVAEQPPSPPRVSLRAYVYYQRDAGLAVKRKYFLYLHFYDRGKQLFRIFNAYLQNDSLLGGLISSAIRSRDGTVIAATHELVVKTAEELKKGTAAAAALSPPLRSIEAQAAKPTS